MCTLIILPIYFAMRPGIQALALDLASCQQRHCPGKAQHSVTCASHGNMSLHISSACAVQQSTIYLLCKAQCARKKKREILVAQGFVHASFVGMKSTDSALRLLRQFRSVLQRDSLRADLDAMYAVSPLLTCGMAHDKSRPLTHPIQLTRSQRPHIPQVLGLCFTDEQFHKCCFVEVLPSLLRRGTA